MVDPPSGQHVTVARHSQTRTVDESWLDGPEARQAKRIAGWPDCTPEAFLNALILVLDALDAGASVLDDELAKRGLSYGEFCKIVADCNVEKRRDGVKSSAAERYGIRRLFLGGFDTQQIAGMLEIPLVDVDEYVANQRMLESGRDIARMHDEGNTPLQISNVLGVTRKTVYKALEDMGLAPHKQLTFLTDQQRRKIVELYKRDVSYSDIASELKIDRSKIANVLRAAHKAGDLPEYGSKSPHGQLHASAS